MNTLDQLVYCSRSQLAPDDERAALLDIVHVAAFLNARNGITGALALQDGVFVQCLEGSPTALDILMLHLHFDERHEEIEVMARGRIERRAFPAWGMTVPAQSPCDTLSRLIAQRSDDLAAWREAMGALLTEPA
ncbi:MULTISPECIES: BLUF domain-containing protein [unclassified Brevundimonas]|uniref:BLUF domain-containing protein n=1 Tax=unclassified Brevundimonas TaxID=2622653 RepID=UPI000E9A2904|nr:MULTISPECIES: BLUF domain-containing protein [unclassified Brevundimonas]HBY42171.1 blue light sensor protein [Brevundimonas sp.]